MTRDDVALLREAEAAGARGLRQLADQADDRRREDRALAAPRCRARRCRRRPGSPSARQASREAGDRARELPGDVRLLGVAEVEAVGEAERLGADAGEVRAALEHRLDRAAVRVARRRAARCRRSRPRSRETARAAASTAASAASGRRTVREPTRQSYCSNAQRREARLALPEQREQELARVRGQARHRLRRRVHRHARRDRLEVVDRALVDQRGDRHVADQRRRRRTPAGAACR